MSKEKVNIVLWAYGIGAMLFVTVPALVFLVDIRLLASLLLILISGSFEAVMDYLQFYYDKQDRFWNPDLSWENKYVKGKYPNPLTFRGRWMVWTTDGWHMMKFFRNLTLFSGFGIYPYLPQHWWYLIIAIILMFWGVNRIGFTALFYYLKKVK